MEHPLEVERLIGWLSFAVGVSSLQENDSVIFHVMRISTVPYIWITSFIVLGLLLVATTYTSNARCRIIVLLLLSLPWALGLLLVAESGPLGAYGAAAIVVLAHIIKVLWSKVQAPAGGEDCD